MLNDNNILEVSQVSNSPVLIYDEILRKYCFLALEIQPLCKMIQVTNKTQGV